MSGGAFVAALILAVSGIAAGTSTASGTVFDEDEYLMLATVFGPAANGAATGAGSAGNATGPGQSGRVSTGE